MSSGCGFMPVVQSVSHGVPWNGYHGKLGDIICSLLVLRERHHGRFIHVYIACPSVNCMEDAVLEQGALPFLEVGHICNDKTSLPQGTRLEGHATNLPMVPFSEHSLFGHCIVSHHKCNPNETNLDLLPHPLSFIYIYYHYKSQSLTVDEKCP